jgi:predicted cation transporter
MVLAGLCAILLIVLVLPFLWKPVEHNLEVFLFVMGLAAALIARQMSWHLAEDALRDPIPITLAVLSFGLLFKWTRRLLDRGIKRTLRIIPLPAFIFLLILLLGGLSSVITAIIAALLLVEIVGMLSLDRAHEAKIVIIACFAIGLGAALTPIGEPLSTIAISKLRDWPGVDFWYLMRLLGWEVGAAVLALAIISIFVHERHVARGTEMPHVVESYGQVLLRAGKVYLFVMALVLLGQGFKPVIDQYVAKLPGDALYWINTISAVLDNATLTAAEIGTSMTPVQVKKLLMGLLIAGGMLIPGNIPNIIAAGKLRIGSRTWAQLGVPLGLAMMLVFFFVLEME